MLELVKIEFLKQKHQKLNLVVYGVIALYLVLIFYYVNDARGLFDSFPFVYKFSLSYLNFLILPLYCVSYTIQAFGVEYRYNIINNLQLASANMLKTFWAKVLYIEINALLIMMFTYVSVSLFALLSRFSSTVTLLLLLRFLYLCISSGLLIPVAVFPLVAFVMIKGKGKDIIGNLVGVIYVLVSFFLARTSPNISPITSATSLIWEGNSEGVVLQQPASVSSIVLGLSLFVLSFLSIKFWLRKAEN